ncbi:MAG: PKD domain-containing protein [Cyclobacteriaceae bacterium]|jgi:hypothetical protein|nr:PKD domain-containing protein [Flammeovirgaceae bacterium]
MRRLLLLFALAFVFAGVSAQTEPPCHAEKFFQQHQGCDPSLRGGKCIQLDISHSLDKDGKEFVYAWNFGDGVTKQGYLTEYCYEHFGTYQITLDLLDPVTNLVIKNELSTEITLLPPIEYKTDTLKGPSPFIRFDPGLMPGIKVKEIFWKIEDQYFCGEMIRISSLKEGAHVVEVGVNGVNASNEVFTGCTLIGIFIQPKP